MNKKQYTLADAIAEIYADRNEAVPTDVAEVTQMVESLGDDGLAYSLDKLIKEFLASDEPEYRMVAFFLRGLRASSINMRTAVLGIGAMAGSEVKPEDVAESEWLNDQFEQCTRIYQTLLQMDLIKMARTQWGKRLKKMSEALLNGEDPNDAASEGQSVIESLFASPFGSFLGQDMDAPASAEPSIDSDDTDRMPPADFFFNEDVHADDNWPDGEEPNG